MFDRGIPDCIAYAEYLDVDPTSCVLVSDERRYRADAFVLEPWEEIYTVDDERTMSFADTVTFHDVLVDVYERAGYRLIDVPRDSVKERAAFVSSFIADPGRELPAST